MTKRKILSALIVLGWFVALPFAATLADGSESAAMAGRHLGMALKATDVATVHQHLHHVLNCLVGPGGDGFDAAAGNPCEKSGAAIPQTTDAQAKAKLEKAAADARRGIAEPDLDKAKQAVKDVQMALK